MLCRHVKSSSQYARVPGPRGRPLGPRLRRYTPGGIRAGISADFDGSLSRCTQFLSTSSWPANRPSYARLISGSRHPIMWCLVGFCRHITYAIDRTTRIMGYNVSRSAGGNVRACRIPPSYAICGQSGSHPKSMYSIFAAISETNVKNRVHASSSRFDATCLSLSQLRAISGERSIFIPTSAVGIRNIIAN